jgi:magnesium transporter
MNQNYLNQPIREHMRTDFVALEATLTVDAALKQVREKQPAGRIVYFYVTSADGRLLGVVPTRRLLLSPTDKQLAEIMIQPVVAIPDHATVIEACEFFILHKLLAFPIVDKERRLVGIVDVELYTQELTDLDRRESQNHLFQLIGVQLAASQRAVPNLFRRRFPWLLTAVAGGWAAASVIGVNFETASSRFVLPFIPLVLALSSSVAAQSVSLALQGLQGGRRSWSTFLVRLRSELATSALLGLALAVLASMAVFFRAQGVPPILALSVSIFASVLSGGLIGIALPYLFRSINRPSQVAAGPIALAVVDIVTLLIYFAVARLLGV